MIAYNHYIKFIPELRNSIKVKCLSYDVIVVQKSSYTNIEERFKYEMTFFNNQGRDLTLYTEKKFANTLKDQFIAFEVKGVVTFFWNVGKLKLEYITHENFTENLLEYWCLHIILPLFFTIDETYSFLHAGAVEVDDKPILFIAESFGGKSTMTDFFMKMGHTMVSDDKVGTYQKNDQIFAVPSHPHHRPYRQMEDMGYFVDNFTTQIKPIHAIYELVKSEPDAAIHISELNGIEKFISLRYASENNLYFQKPRRFQYLTQLAQSIPVFKVKVPWDMDKLPEVYQSILKHSQQINVKKN